MTCVLGIDPGIHGGYALFWGAQYQPIVETLPLLQAQHGAGGKRQNELNLALLRTTWASYSISHVYIEKVTSMPNEGHAGAHRFGEAKGQLHGLAVGLGLPVTLVTPQVWQKYVGVGPSADAARQRCMQLFPHIAHEFQTKVSAHKADALLIAVYGRAQFAQLVA